MIKEIKQQVKELVEKYVSSLDFDAGCASRKVHDIQNGEHGIIGTLMVVSKVNHVKSGFCEKCDKKFIECEMPELNARLHYRMLDVSAWKVYFENAKNKKFTKREEHRALDDIKGSIEELKWYLTFLK